MPTDIHTSPNGIIKDLTCQPTGYVRLSIHPFIQPSLSLPPSLPPSIQQTPHPKAKKKKQKAKSTTTKTKTNPKKPTSPSSNPPPQKTPKDINHPPPQQFHADNLSSAHIYLRLTPEQKWDDLPKELVEECAQLTKANSIEGELS